MERFYRTKATLRKTMFKWIENIYNFNLAKIILSETFGFIFQFFSTTKTICYFVNSFNN